MPLIFKSFFNISQTVPEFSGVARQKLVGGKSKSDNFMKVSVPAQILSFLLKNTCMPFYQGFLKNIATSLRPEFLKSGFRSYIV